MRTHLIDFCKIAGYANTNLADKQMMRLVNFLTESFAHEHLYLGWLVNGRFSICDCLNLIILSKSFKPTYNIYYKVMFQISSFIIYVKSYLTTLLQVNREHFLATWLFVQIFLIKTICMSRSCQLIVISVIAQMAPRAP